MPYQNELQFLCATYAKYHVQARTASEDMLAETVAQYTSELGYHQPPGLPPINAGVRYRYTDPLGLSYTYLRLWRQEDAPLLLIGPYLSAALSAEQLLELGERIGITPHAQARLAEFFASIPVMEQSNPLFMMLDTFCERIWDTPAFSVVDVNHAHTASPSPIHVPIHTDRLDDVLLSMKAMEQRYAFENELIESVRMGQLHKQELLFSALSDVNFEQRATDPVRNVKNYCIIMNTLLRKAAESGGVHPLYIDRVSSDFAKKIEQVGNLEQSGELMQQIYLGYCKLVRQHAMQQYSHTVQATILLIDSDLSANLTLHSLAQNQELSAGYLSAAFKRETGQTLTAYIRERRMQHARHLLRTTNLQIGTVALHCGIPDVHYFAKIFKKETGMTPGQYRESRI